MCVYIYIYEYIIYKYIYIYTYIVKGSGDNVDKDFLDAIARSLKDKDNDSNANNLKDKNKSNDKNGRDEGTKGDIAYYKSYLKGQGKGDRRDSYEDNDEDMKAAMALSLADLKSPHVTPNKSTNENTIIDILDNGNYDDKSGNTNIWDMNEGTDTDKHKPDKNKDMDKFNLDKTDIKDIWGVNDKNTDITDFSPSIPIQSSKPLAPVQSMDDSPLSLFEPSKPHQSFEPSKPQPLDLFNLSSDSTDSRSKHESQVNPFDDYVEDDISSSSFDSHPPAHPTSTFNNTNTSTNSSMNTPLGTPYTVNDLSTNPPIIPTVNHDFDFLLSKSSTTSGIHIFIST
jgi:hypothetical protein